MILSSRSILKKLKEQFLNQYEFLFQKTNWVKDLLSTNPFVRKLRSLIKLLKSARPIWTNRVFMNEFDKNSKIRRSNKSFANPFENHKKSFQENGLELN